ncbi:NFX1-type zinc finger-containing protein 1-like isoform X2 [Diabrotica virgifera virgifera]|uniref:RZ-type domain-containing protein n=1 Tax=Diabrotica virgifera virgifera TaxID=50390 RepID=A0ABM5K833_DIAVI|nr:NFX1-type zinc finger-containing protein 1-like isoform X2 [Diabrotica virgifera virgifera]
MCFKCNHFFRILRKLICHKNWGKRDDDQVPNFPGNEKTRERNRGFDPRPECGRGRGGGRGHYRVPGNNDNDDNDRGFFPGKKENNESNRTRKPHQMGFKALEELIDNDNIEEIILDLNDGKKGFKTLLGSTLSTDMIVLVVKLLAKICDSAFNASKTSILQFAIESDFSKQVTSFVTGLAIQDSKDKMHNKYFWKDIDDFWNNIIKISEHYNDLLPSSSCDFTVKLLKSVKFNIPPIEEIHSIHISDGIKNKVDSILEVTETKQKELDAKKRIKKEPNFNLALQEPPDDFREISVYPSTVEITTEKSPFLRPNIVKGPYPDVNTYLDIQYRLLREDFVMPLRKGICGYINNPRDKQQDIKVYEGVKFLKAESINDQNCQRIQFDFSKKNKKFEFENSKRFMFGSLLCFTDDRFKTLLFGKIVDRKEELLKNGQLIVGFNSDMELPAGLYHKSFLLVESKVYFEPYYQVLTVLKNMTIEHFPMERYIIQVRTDTKPPRYLSNIDHIFTFSQPYGLNEAQDKAFQSALTREFAIIQGPPGTGKTFLALNIARTMLENNEAWYNDSPMLIVCFTNHALDQFLEGLLETTDEIIRVGGQSKNEKLNDYNLRNIKRVLDSPNRAISERQLVVRKIKRDIESINNYLKIIAKYDTVVDFGTFSGVVPEYATSWFATAENDHIINWLFGGHNRKFGKRRVNNVQNNQNIIKNVEDNPLKNEENENNDRERNELVDDIFKNLEVKYLRTLVSIEKLSTQMILIGREVHNLMATDGFSECEKEMRKAEYDMKLYAIENQLEYLKFRLQEAQAQKLGPPDYINLENPHWMSADDRWKLYFQWIYVYERHLLNKKALLSTRFREEYAVYTEMRDIEDTNVMKEALVVGMTTTGAARLNTSLKALRSPIVIVEEAAEVLESHIITALTPHCQHLILIGDHQQLKPSTASYHIETKYKLNISLFQRMVDNNVECHTLNIQHRMRPEIANLIRPAIYPVLHDHESVRDRPKIIGIEHTLFFIDHEHAETSCNDNSKKNVHESQFLMHLAKHLVLNGYEAENIVILAAYLGQMLEMQRERRIHSDLLENVRIAVLDNYQGEESDIVLLSLVRSNKENKIGFLRTENRVCVALSRARNGFYIMGNMIQLRENSEIWPQVEDTLKNQDAIGPYLTLRCQVHRDQITKVKSGKDFLKIPEGGCTLKCEAQLKCGHYCTSICHVLDRDHEIYQCRQPCASVLCDDMAHICQKYCYEECGPCNYPVRRELKCGHVATMECHMDPDIYKCNTLVTTKLACGHNAEKPCHIEPDKFPCQIPCDVSVKPCGHACIRKCHVNDDPYHLQYQCRKPCEREVQGCTSTEERHKCNKACFEKCLLCEIIVEKRRAKCSHLLNVACSLDPDTIICEKPCEKKLPCGHICEKKCGEPCGNCRELVKKSVPDCNHVIKIECRNKAERKYCIFRKCPRILPCGHQCKKKCNETCITRCEELVSCNIPSPCGHIIKEIQCYQKESDDPKILLAQCSEPCNFTLQCKHTCSGICRQCFQGRFHQKCAKKCGVPLVCNHECTIPCGGTCQPCQKPCSYRCTHGICKKRCGEPCTNCKEACVRKCDHQECKRCCGDICNVPPCYEPCPKKIRGCGHLCIGFCGDPCPSLCRICNGEELTECFFETKNEEDARFVLLVDCGHILESSGMEQWLESDDNQINPKVCPKCKTGIKLTQRYNEYVKGNLTDLQNVKTKFYGTEKENRKVKAKLQSELQLLMQEFRIFGIGIFILADLRKLYSRLNDGINTRRLHINKVGLAAIRAKVDIFKLLLEPLKNYKVKLQDASMSMIQFKFISNYLMEHIDSISKQQYDDIMLEIDRFYKRLQFENIKYQPYLIKPEVKRMVEAVTQLLDSPQRFTKSRNDIVKIHLEDLKKVTASNIALTDAERKEIVKAMGFTQGHWYKCPNGHPHSIADCSGAVVTSICNECKEQIRGSSHGFLSTNRVATEIDGARYEA